MNAEIEEADMNLLPALISAMIAVESGGDFRAVGDGGRALGILQIHKEVIADVNRIYKTSFRHKDSLNPVLAREICELYLRHYAAPVFAQGATPGKLCALSELQNAEICARIWNGGPAGWKKEATRGYWEKVRREMSAVRDQKSVSAGTKSEENQ